MGETDRSRIGERMKIRGKNQKTEKREKQIKENKYNLWTTYSKKEKDRTGNIYTCRRKLGEARGET